MWTEKTFSPSDKSQGFETILIGLTVGVAAAHAQLQSNTSILDILL